jgi:hypothetical protein
MSYVIIPFDNVTEHNHIIFHVNISIYSTHYKILITEPFTNAIVYCSYLDELTTYKLYDIDCNDINFLLLDMDINKNGITFINYKELYGNYKETYDMGIIEVEYDVKLCF